MIRRAFAGLLAAALLVLAPTAAFGYAEDDFDLLVPVTNPAPGETFEVTIVAPVGTQVTLTVSAEEVPDDAIQIAGTKSLTKTSGAEGAAVFALTLTEEAVYDIVATDPDGNVIGTAQVTVGDGVPGEVDEDRTEAPGTGVGGDRTEAPGAGVGSDRAGGAGLPETGATATPLIIGGVMLLLVGGAALLLARRGKVTA